MTGARTDEPMNGNADGAPLSCWSCAGPVATQASFCHTCGAIQPPRAVDFFARLGLRPTFDLDGDDLERRYFAFQRSFHPDRFAGKSRREQAFSLQHAVGINEAYDSLKSPLKRAEYLLELQHDPRPGDAGTTTEDPNLLVEAMEMREELDAADGVAAVDALLARVTGEVEHCVGALGVAFADRDIGKAAALAARYKYLDKLIEEARRRRSRLADGG